MEEPITRDRVERAITWYKRNKEAITQRLPLTVSGVTYKAGWVDCMDRQIVQWENSKLVPLNLAVVYIHRPICMIRNAMKADALPN
jgi:hypothetical protein